MTTAVADTNIYISALLFGGPCEAILGLARASLLELYDSPAIERELRRVLREKFCWTDRQVRDAVLELRLITTRIERPPLYRGGSASKKNGLPAPSHHSEAARCASTEDHQAPSSPHLGDRCRGVYCDGESRGKWLQSVTCWVGEPARHRRAGMDRKESSSGATCPWRRL